MQSSDRSHIRRSGLRPRPVIFRGNDAAIAEPHAAEKAVLQHQLMIERGRDMGRDQDGQQRRKGRMAWNVGSTAKLSGRGGPLGWNAPLMSHPVDHPLAIIRNTITYNPTCAIEASRS